MTVSLVFRSMTRMRFSCAAYRPRSWAIGISCTNSRVPCVFTSMAIVRTSWPSLDRSKLLTCLPSSRSTIATLRARLLTTYANCGCAGLGAMYSAGPRPSSAMSWTTVSVSVSTTTRLLGWVLASKYHFAQAACGTANRAQASSQPPAHGVERRRACPNCSIAGSNGDSERRPDQSSSLGKTTSRLRQSS